MSNRRASVIIEEVQSARSEFSRLRSAEYHSTAMMRMGGRSVRAPGIVSLSARRCECADFDHPSVFHGATTELRVLRAPA